MKTIITTIALIFAFTYSVKAQEILTAKTINCIHSTKSISKDKNIVSLYDWVIDIENKHEINNTNDTCYESYMRSSDKKHNANNLDFKNSAIPLVQRNESSATHEFNNSLNLDLNYGLDFRINI